MLNHVLLFVTPWSTARQASLSITNSRSLPKLMSIESVMPSNNLILLSSSPPAFQSFLASGSFQMSQLFASGGQNIGVSASTSVFPMNIQDWFPLGWTGWISYINIISTYKLNVAWKPKSSHWKCLCEYINSIILQVWSQPFYQFLITLHMQASVHQWECSLNHYN